jgi:uncharacterized protein (DUF3084 family)
MIDHDEQVDALYQELKVVRDKEAALRDELLMARGQVKQIAMERERFRSEVYYAQIAAQAQVEQLRKDLDMARRDALAFLVYYEDRLPVNDEVLIRTRGYRRLLDGWKTIQEMADKAITPDPNAETRQAEVRAVRDQLRAVTAERDKALAEIEQTREIALDRIEAVEAKCDQVQRDAVAVLDAYAKGNPVPGDLMDRIKRYGHSLVIQAALAKAARSEGTVSLYEAPRTDKP